MSAYENSLFNDGHTITEETDIRHIAGCKLMAMRTREEYALITEAFGETPDIELEDVMGSIRAALFDETAEHDAEIGAWLRERLVEYIRPTIIKDREREAALKGWNSEPQEHDAQCASDIIDRQEIAHLRRAS